MIKRYILRFFQGKEEMRAIVTGLFVAVFLVLNVSMVLAGAKKGEQLMVGQGKTVAFDYELTVEGKQVDTSKGRGPLEYIHGKGQIIPGLEHQIEGMKVGDSKSVVVAAKDAYGVLNPEAFQEVPKKNLPKEMPLEIGMVLKMTTPEGEAFPGVIKEIKEDSVIVDFNHPLAGKELNFKITIVSIK